VPVCFIACKLSVIQSLTHTGSIQYASPMKHKQPAPALDSSTACIICGKPVPLYRGNFNANRTPICADPACKHERKLRLQNERRHLARKGLSL